MTIRSLQSVDGIPFGADRLALSKLGTPLRERRNREGEDEVTFPTAIYRFAAGKLVEVSFRLPDLIDLNGEAVAGDALISYLRRHDSDFRECHGFAVAPTLGLAVDLDHGDHWTSAFGLGRWDKIR